MFMCEHWIGLLEDQRDSKLSLLQGLPVSGNKQDLIERLQSSLLDDGDDLLDQVGISRDQRIQSVPRPARVAH